METRANYVVIGMFTLAVVAGVFGFVYWFQNIGGTGERAIYRVEFEGSVSGLRTGGSVLFNGIRVGEVTGLALNPKRPQAVIATISIDKSIAVRSDTEAGLEFQGLTGIASAEFIMASSISLTAWPNWRFVGCGGMAKSLGETGMRPAARVSAIFLSSCSRALGRNTSGPAR